MSSNRYALAGNGVVTYGIESTKYTAESDPNTEFGVTNEDIEPTNENPQTAMTTGGGGRQPYLHSPDPRDNEFDVPTVLHNADAPFEVALGNRTTTSKTDYDEVLFTEADILPTMTVQHIHQGLDMVATYVGCKADLDIEWSSGDPLQASFAIVAAEHDYDDTESAPSFTPSIDADQTPFRAHMQGNLTLSDPSDDSLIKEVATVNGGTWAWSNGLEAQRHGGSDTDTTRPGAYSVAETTAADRYDFSLDVNITDTDLYKRVYNDEARVDAEIPFARQVESNTITDGIILRANKCKLTSGPVPNPAEGVIEGELQLQPRDGTEIEVRVPT